MNRKIESVNVRPWFGGVLVTLLLSASVWSQEAVGPVIRIKHDPNSYEGGLSHQMHQRITKRMWDSRIGSIPETPNKEQNELRDLISQLNAVRIKRQAVVAPPEPALKPPSKVTQTPASPAAIVDANTVTPQEGDGPLEVQGPLTSRTLARIIQIQDANERVEHPLELAEVLYANGYPQHAQKFYEYALSEADPNHPLDRAWVLLQLGNCHKRSNLLEAGRYYSQVIERHADSPWASVARVQLALVRLYIDNRPQELLQENRGLPAEPPVAKSVQ